MYKKIMIIPQDITHTSKHSLLRAKLAFKAFNVKLHYVKRYKFIFKAV